MFLGMPCRAARRIPFAENPLPLPPTSPRLKILKFIVPVCPVGIVTRLLGVHARSLAEQFHWQRPRAIIQLIFVKAWHESFRTDFALVSLLLSWESSCMVRVRGSQLEQRRTTSIYRQRLNEGLNLLLTWLVRLEVGAVSLLGCDKFDPIVLDQWICDYINFAWGSGRKF